MELAAHWLSLMEYATLNGVSLSTLRRHIKAGKVDFRVENGRYLIRNATTSHIYPSTALSVRPAAVHERPAPTHSREAQAEIAELRLQLQKARQEIAELKTLVAFYEDDRESPNGSS
ncbi:MAG: hypothetical protein RJB38_2127 [Pseudomonadota bacterium]|jgi:hypothetical protein